MTGKFNDRDLHAQAEAVERDFSFTCETGRDDFTFDASVAETARHQDAIQSF